MLPWKMRRPLREKLISCGESPEGMRPTIRPRRVSMTSTVRAVEAETSSRRPLGDSAMWSARYPSTGTRQTIRPERTLMATTSAKLGREK